MTKRRDLILAAVENYDWERLRPFLESLHATGYDGEVRFFVDNVSPETLARLAEAGVQISRPWRLRVRVAGRVFHPYNPRTTRVRWHVQPLYRHLVRAATVLARDRRLATARIAGALSNIEIARFFWYFTYLSQTANQYRNVMLTDTRDVLFLRPPFDFDIGDRACFFLEDERVTLGEQLNNRGWLAGAYGVETLQELADRPISCSGVTIGAASAVLEYLETMVDELAHLPWQWKGMDQGVHNYILHTDRLQRATLVGNREGAVLTLGIMSRDDALAALKERAPHAHVVHQYDRDPAVADALGSLTTVPRGT